MEHAVSYSFFLIFSGAALLATIALYTRQPLLIAYIVLGAIVGPYGMNWINDLSLMSDASSIGIMFLLFLLGLDMQPHHLITTVKQATLIAIASSIAFFAAGFSIGYLFNFNQSECFIIGAALMFSSTIIGIKLLPTTILHHKHMGELMVGLLLLQDVLAIMVLLVMLNAGGDDALKHLLLAALALPVLAGLTYLAVKFVIIKLIMKFDRFHEYIFLVAIGWCLGVAELAKLMGLSHEIGAFIAGISLATSPIAQYIALSLKPLRDFFLVLFFFTLGARFDISLLPTIIIPAMILAAIVLSLKPVIYFVLLRGFSENKELAWDIGFRLGQISEFSLLIAYLAESKMMISTQASLLIQATAIITFVVSSYIVIFNYPTPIAVTDKLRRD
jgi:Kef-type K+ transport system membrane component KefB